jgi:acetoin utilization deacetylase AcuC-like enzyme
MNLAIIHHPDCLLHAFDANVFGRPERIQVIEDSVKEAFPDIPWFLAPKASLMAVSAVHPRRYVRFLDRMEPASGEVTAEFIGETVLSPGSMDAARRAAGAGIMGVDLVLTGRAKNVFCSVRPPGHHAEPTEILGYCILNNTAIAAHHAVHAHGLDRVAIVDFDAHHGNGTQTAVWSNPHILYASTHQYPWYPFSGSKIETGLHNNIVNCPLPALATGVLFREAFVSRIFPALARWRPQLIILSAGFDAHYADPLANLCLDDSDFEWMTERILDLGLPVVSMLEGGYNLPVLAKSAVSHVKILSGRH